MAAIQDTSSATELSLFPLDRASFVPYYKQIVDQIQHLIESRKLSPGQPFWPEGAVARKLGVSKMTVRQAFQSLRGEGLLVVERGKAPVVGPGRVLKNFQELRGFTEEMRRRGLAPSSRLLAINLVEADFETAATLHLAENEKVFRIRRLRLANNECVGMETTHLPARLFPALEKQDLEKQSLYFIMETIYGVKLECSEEELQAVPAGLEEARLLSVKRGFPLFFMRRKVYSTEGKLVEYALSVFRGDRYSATVISRRRKQSSTPRDGDKK